MKKNKQRFLIQSIIDKKIQEGIVLGRSLTDEEGEWKYADSGLPYEDVLLTIDAFRAYIVDEMKAKGIKEKEIPEVRMRRIE